MPNREDVMAVYAKGPEAVVALVGEMVTIIVVLAA